MRETMLLSRYCFGNCFRRVVQFGIRILHQVAYGKNHLVKKWLGVSQQSPMCDRTSNDLPQHISAAVIRGQHAVRNRNVAARE